MLQYHFRWKTLPMMAGITWWNFYFKLFPGSIKAPQIIEFLQHLQRHLRRRLLVIWDGLPGHRSIAVRDFVASQGERLTLEFLPGYAPELNPDEGVWKLAKHALANGCPMSIADLKPSLARVLHSIRKSPKNLRGCINHSGLPSFLR